ncbi:MAG: hypothetical protein NT007_13910 [Candidatus Kapabacteria bacterium]|nr:hypothetical protein [Candidatus Kapabacteria bacterium]
MDAYFVDWGWGIIPWYEILWNGASQPVVYISLLLAVCSFVLSIFTSKISRFKEKVDECGIPTNLLTICYISSATSIVSFLIITGILQMIMAVAFIVMFFALISLGAGDDPGSIDY